jgi:TolB-like protein/DNA-binding winged helix-turn-helix (wHTH) protein/Tfp pilus assembly protein PilF
MAESIENARFYDFGRFRLDLEQRVLFCEQQPVNLPPKVFDTLRVLVQKNRSIVERDELMTEVWADSFVEEGNLSVNISALRKALGKMDDGGEFIETVPRRGYRFRASVTELSNDDVFVAKRRFSALVRTTVDESERDEAKLMLPAAASPWWRRWYVVAAVVGLILLAAGFSVYRYRTTRPRPTHSLAVLPFKTDGGDSAIEGLADGLSEDLIDRLSQVAQLRVIAQSSTFRYKGQAVDTREAARSLGVEAVLAGSIRKEGDRLLIKAELIDARDATIIWSEQYRVGVADAQNVEQLVLRRISERLSLNMTRAQYDHIARPDTANSAAYQLYLSGLLAMRRKDKNNVENIRAAIAYFEQAVALDPNFARAYNSLALACRGLQFSSGIGDRNALNEKMHRAIAKALELDESLPQVHLTLAAIKMNDLDWASAEHEYKRALELNPNYAGAHAGYAGFLSNFERHAEAATEARLAHELDPLSLSGKLGVGRALMLARRFDEAIEYFQQLNQAEPDRGPVHFFFGLTLSYKHKYAEAMAEFAKDKSLIGTSPGIFRAAVIARAGKPDEARKLLEQVKAAGDYSPAEMAIGYLALGEKDEALALLERAYQERDIQLQFLRVDPDYDDIRDDPRFQDLLRRIGLIG